MKKVVLVLGLATLFSCEKEKEDKVCDCRLEIEYLDSNGVLRITKYPSNKDFCENAEEEWTAFANGRRRYVCE